MRSQVFGERIARALLVPEDADDPPAIAVIEKLNAVDAARERLAARSAARFIAAENLRDVAELFDAIGDGRFVEGVRHEISAAALDVVFHAAETRVDFSLGVD